MIDRFHSPERNRLRISGLALLLVGADTIPNLFDSIKSQYQLTLEYNEKLKEAYSLGLSLL